MKHLKFIAFLLAICASMGMLVSCGDDDDDVKPLPDGGDTNVQLLSVTNVASGYELMGDISYDSKGRIISYKHDFYLYEISYSSSKIVVTQTDEDAPDDPRKFEFYLSDGRVVRCNMVTDSYTDTAVLTYNGSGRLTERVEKRDGNLWYECSYTYDNAGNLKSKQEEGYMPSRDTYKYQYYYSDVKTTYGLNYKNKADDLYSGGVWWPEAALVVQGYLGDLPSYLIETEVCDDQYSNSSSSYSYDLYDNGTVKTVYIDGTAYYRYYWSN